MNTTASSLPQATHTFRPSFFFVMTLVMAFFVFAGFGMTYFIPLAGGTFPPAPPVVHWHGIVFSSWMILLCVQAGLVNFGNIRLHRSLGTWGIAHGTLVLLTGALISVIGWTDFGEIPPVFPPGLRLDAVYLSFTAVIGFGLLFTLAIRNTRRPEVHKRLILFAMLPVLPPGVNRFWMVPFGLENIPPIPLYLTLNAMSAAILIQEWRSSGTIARTSMLGAGYLLLQTALHEPASTSLTLMELAKFFGDMVYYR